MTTKKKPNAHTRAVAKYNATNVKQYVLKLNVNTDTDLIEYLESIEGSRQGYLKELIRNDMAKKNPAD